MSDLSLVGVNDPNHPVLGDSANFTDMRYTGGKDACSPFDRSDQNLTDRPGITRIDVDCPDVEVSSTFVRFEAAYGDFYHFVLPGGFRVEYVVCLIRVVRLECLVQEGFERFAADVRFAHLVPCVAYERVW